MGVLEGNPELNVCRARVTVQVAWPDSNTAYLALTLFLSWPSIFLVCEKEQPEL